MSDIRVGWIGCGGIAGTHARQMQAGIDGLRITVAVDIERERAENMARLLGGARVATDYREVMDDVDAVLLALPHHLHAPISVDFLRAGKHVLVEKPMANSEAECLEMLAAADASGKTLMVGYCMRYHPLVRAMRRMIAEKQFGDTFQVSIWTEQYTHYKPPHWGLSADKLGGGQFFSHGCHYIDILLWYLGRPLRGVHLGTNLGTPWMEKEGTSNVILQFENGAMGYHFGTWGARGTRLRYAFHAHCTEGMLELDLRAGELRLLQGNDVKVLDRCPDDELKPMMAQMRHFLDCIRTGEKPMTDPVGSLEGLRIIWALYRSETSGVMADLRRNENEE